ncbi:uncharacterized protein LOC143715248 isoform X2 [Siphateles boraxobius]|uniref:uncharacterized protein LOC143715248 isoform X2 n=1 Tax=Siphateles boraxobius TaxID=180520 RepID=UPI004063A16E
MAPAVILIGCLLATMSCLTTALNTTTANPAINSTANRPINSTANPPINSTANPAINSTTNRPINSTTNRPINSTANTPINPAINSTTNRPINSTTNRPIGSCANPDLCCSGRNRSCRRLNCFCDVACLRFGDCCPDFKPTCFTVNNSSNVTEPNNTLTLTGTCSQPTLCCSGIDFDCFRGCFCDVACLRLNDCCPDFKPTCFTVNNSSNVTEPNNTLTVTGTCSQPTLCCSGIDLNCFRGCFCDEACKYFNDCCPDFNNTCIFDTTTAAPPFNSTIRPPFNSTINHPCSTTASPKDVLTLLTNLEVEVLAEESSTEEERQAALREVAALLESYLRAYNTDIYSFEVTRIEPVSSSSSTPCD